MKILSLCALCVLTVMLLATQAQAQSCPVGITNPLQILDGTTWTFSTEASQFGPTGSALQGHFTASINAFGQGVLNVVETVNQLMTTGVITRDANVSGRFQVYSDCSGGELMFMFSGFAVQYEFVFAGHFTELYLLSDSININGVQNPLIEIQVGTAVRF